MFGASAELRRRNEQRRARVLRAMRHARNGRTLEDLKQITGWATGIPEVLACLEGRGDVVKRWGRWWMPGKVPDAPPPGALLEAAESKGLPKATLRARRAAPDTKPIQQVTPKPGPSQGPPELTPAYVDILHFALDNPGGRAGQLAAAVQINKSTSATRLSYLRRHKLISGPYQPITITDRGIELLRAQGHRWEPAPGDDPRGDESAGLAAEVTAAIAGDDPPMGLEAGPGKVTVIEAPPVVVPAIEPAATATAHGGASIPIDGPQGLGHDGGPGARDRSGDPDLAAQVTGKPVNEDYRAKFAGHMADIREMNDRIGEQIRDLSPRLAVLRSGLDAHTADTQAQEHGAEPPGDPSLEGDAAEVTENSSTAPSWDAEAGGFELIPSDADLAGPALEDDAAKVTAARRVWAWPAFPVALEPIRLSPCRLESMPLSYGTSSARPVFERQARIDGAHALLGFTRPRRLPSTTDLEGDATEVTSAIAGDASSFGPRGRRGRSDGVGARMTAARRAFEAAAPLPEPFERIADLVEHHAGPDVAQGFRISLAAELRAHTDSAGRLLYDTLQPRIARWVESCSAPVRRGLSRNDTEALIRVCLEAGEAACSSD